MLKALVTISLLAILFFQLDVVERFKKPVAACSEPITYTIGTFDRRFAITQKEFLSALREAEAVWEKPFGLELFAYAPENGDLKVNLIYDYRQEATTELAEIESEVKEDEASYRVLEARYLRLKAEHLQLKSLYEERVERFNEMNATYERHVEEWNSGSRNSRNKFEALEAERLALQEEIFQLKILENSLNQKVEEVNALVERLNRVAKELNLNVEEFNTIGASRGETFAGGIYSSDGEERKIDIYEFKSHDKLVRILAHELGHALGLEHVDDERAIMYKLNEGETGVATQTDLNSLKTLCKIN